MRRIFVGDIQGCLGPLQDLLDAVQFAPGVDQLYPVGDLVNKGPDSVGVLRLLMELDARAVLGNHDLSWLRKGRLDDPGQVAWLEGQPIVRVLDDVIAVHAGLHPKWTEADLHDLSETDIRFAVTVRYCDENGVQPPVDFPPPAPPFLPWYEFYRGTRRVIFGHWARQGLLVRDDVIGLDTGCCYGRELTAWIAEEDRIVQVPGWIESQSGKGV